jgi:6-pyruvoyltetrahydropterin/6-carboxytetrahydropterin synthase
MYTIVVEGEFDSAHKLRGYKGKCAHLHGHTWRFQLHLSTEKLTKIGITIDFKQAKRWVKAIEEAFDHKDLNQIFKKENPTAENISRRICFMAKAMAGDCCRVEKVALWETPKNCIEYVEA